MATRENLYEIGTMLPTIASMRPSMTKTEQNVVDALLQAPEEVIYLSITDFAERAGVSDATVMRFCRKLGLKGYQSFKLALAQELSGGGNSRATEGEGMAPDDSVDAMVQKRIEISTNSLRETASLLRNNDVEKAVEAIEQSSRIVLFGVGASYLAALDAKYKFMRIGVHMDVLPDGHMQAMLAAQCKQGELAIAITHSGSASDTVDALRVAKEQGATTVCITHHLRSPVTNYADIILLNGHAEGPFQGGALATRVAQMLVVDVLYTEYFRRNMEKAMHIRKATSRSIADRLY